MASVNKVFLLGHVGKDPEIRYLPSGVAIANFSLATSSKRKDKNSGELIEETQWHRIQCFDRLAEIVGEYVFKGSPIFIEGRIKYGEYTDKDGVKRYTTDIVAVEMQMLGTKQDRQQGGQQRSSGANETREQAQQQRPPQRQAPAAQPGGGPSGFDDISEDIPFITASAFYDMTTSKQRRMARRGGK